jgi:hypothetical protein
MEYLKPNELKTSVQKYFNKGGNIIDISIDNINPNFCIDNYKPSNILHNSDFRREFNSLCKGKTEAKNMEEKPKIDNKKIYLCKEGQIRDIPFILQPLFSKHKNYYIYGTPGKFSFYHSILNIVNSDFILQGSIYKEKMIDECKNNLVYKIDELYKKFNYRKMKFPSKTVIRENLLNSSVFLPQVNTYIADYYNMCLLIIDTQTYLYSIMNDFSKDKEFIIMIRKNNYFQPILGVDGKHKFSWEIMKKISGILKPEFEMDINLEDVVEKVVEKVINEIVEEKVVEKVINEVVEETVNKENKIVNTDEPIKLEKMWKYKLSDLQNIALKLDIDIKLGRKNKKIIDLYTEIEQKIN